MRKKSEIQSAFNSTDMLRADAGFFLVGIGGAGMSALARVLLARGLTVRGTDSTDSPTIGDLRELGAEVWIGHTGDPLQPGDQVIFSDAIDLDTSPEARAARELGLPFFRRSQLLGWILSGHRTIAVTGTHGKTSTTGMVACALQAAGLDPLVIVGASVPQFGGPVILGSGEWAVVEACEAYDALQDIRPDIAILTNLEADHLDYHGSYESLEASVLTFVEKARDGLVFCESDRGASELAHHVSGAKYGCDERTFEFLGKKARPLAAPGQHNRLNAGLALMAAQLAGADPQKAAEGIAGFEGAHRRLQVLRESSELTVIDDYAHHPTEIAASIAALRTKYPGRRLIVVYQPHLYSRTADFLPDFATALDQADLVVLTDIYPAREEPIPGVSSARIAEQLKRAPVRYVPSRHLLPREVAALVQSGDVVVGMGAGNIETFAPDFLQEIDRPTRPSIAVIYGGDSAEREVSLLSGREVASALRSRGYSVSLIDISDQLLSGRDLSGWAGPGRPGLAFLAVHGTNAEDGAFQGLFEMLHIPYTGSGVQASAIAMDKALTKQVLERAGLPVPNGELTDRAIDFPTPCIVKPNAQGSTVGLSFVERPEDLGPAIERALQYDRACLVEEWVRGTEISVPVLGDQVLPVVEIVPRTGRYDFQSKYEMGATEEICPARLDPEVTQRAQEYALRAHRALGCSGATRTDMIVRADGSLVLLEVNTLPGMTKTSLLPRSAAVAGLSFEDLCERIVQLALPAQVNRF